MGLTRLNHLAFITPDMEGTIRFYRDLLGMKLVAGVGHDGYRHYFFKFGDDHVAFFEYEGASVMEEKFHGSPTTKPLGFDHVSFSVDTVEELFAYKDKLEAAGLDVTGAIDHGTIWSIYFFDNNNIPLEISWDGVEMLKAPIMAEDEPMDIVAEGADPQPGHWPEVTERTPPERFVAKPGNGYDMLEATLKDGYGRMKPELAKLLALRAEAAE